MEQVLQYLKNEFDDNVSIIPIKPPKSLSLALQGNYIFFNGSLLSTKFLMIKPTQEISAKNLVVQRQRIEDTIKTTVVVLLKSATRYQTKKLLSEKIPFVIAHKQIYLPFLYLHLQSPARRAAPIPQKAYFSATEQLLFLVILYANRDYFTARELAEKLNISLMSISRTTNALQQYGLLQSKMGGKTGRQKILIRIPINEYYQNGTSYLQSPVRETIFLRTLPEHLVIYKSGLTALGEQTMLSEPNLVTYATFVPSAQLPEIRAQAISKEEAETADGFALQILKYNPSALHKGQAIYLDPVSVLLSLTDMDERIEQAIETLMEDYKWYEA